MKILSPVHTNMLIDLDWITVGMCKNYDNRNNIIMQVLMKHLDFGFQTK